MAEELFVVTGASGHVGRGIARRLLEAGRRVRVVARQAGHLEPLVKKGAEPAVGSVDDPAFVRKTFQGAKAVFVMIPPNFAVQAFRAWQNQVADIAAEATKVSGATHALILSSIGGHLAQGAGPVNGLHDLEERFNALALNVLHLRPGPFMENHLPSVGMIKQMGVMGSALKGDQPMAMIATRDIGEVGAKRLLALDFTGHSVLELMGPRDVAMNEVARAFGEAIGKPDLKYQQFPYEEAEQAFIGMGVPREMAGLYTEMTRGFNEGLVKPTQQRSPQTTTPTTIEQFAREVFAPAFRAS